MNAMNTVGNSCWDTAPPGEKKETEWELTQAVQKQSRNHEKLFPHLQTPKGPKRNQAVPFQGSKELSKGVDVKA